MRINRQCHATLICGHGANAETASNLSQRSAAQPSDGRAPRAQQDCIPVIVLVMRCRDTRKEMSERRLDATHLLTEFPPVALMQR